MLLLYLEETRHCDILVSVVAIIIFAFGLWIGDSVATARAAKERQTAISNAVAMVEDTRIPLTCKDNDIIQAIKAMALNGSHVEGYKLWLEIDRDGSVAK
jgi:hypothetical protein